MDTCIIFPNGNAGISICYPMDGARRATETDTEFLTRIARQDVPTGMPFRFVLIEHIPTDRTERELWTADFSTPDGYGD